MVRHFLPILLLTIFILPAIWSLFHPGFFLSDDGEWMIIRFSAFHQALVDGQFPVRWLGRLNHEYGYPVANFLYPGFMYLAEIPKILGFGFVDSIKITLGLSMVGSAIFTYLWLSKIFGRFPAFVGALFYVYAPYHLYDIYTRGSVGEILALAIVPFCLWMAEKKNLPFLALGYGLLILSHNTLALLFTPVLTIYLLLTYGLSLYAIRYTLYAFLLGLGLSAFFWIPAIFDLKYTIFRETLVVNWQSAFFTVGHFRLLDWSAVFVFFLCLFLLRKMDKRALFFWLLFPFTFFLTLPISKIIWEIVPLNQIVQFSFRFLFWMVLSGAFLAAFLLNYISRRLKIILGIVLVGFLLMFYFPFTQPKSFFDKGEGFYATNEGTTTVRSEYMPRWVKIFPTERPRQKVEIAKGEGEIERLFFNSREVVFRADLRQDSLIQVNTIYFPGWEAWSEEKKIALSYENERGLIQIPLKRGEHRVLVKFGETPLRLFSDIISLASFLIVGGLLTRRYLFQRK